MASNIIFNTIDEAYPVAGVDNNTQGFRDNFSVIKTGLQTANAEIDALQTNAIVKGPLTSGGAVDNDFAGVKISDAVLNQVTEKYFTLSDVQTSQEINFSNGHMQSIRYTGKVGYNITENIIRESAQICIINILGILNNALEGDLDKINKCVKLGVFINSTTKYKNHSIIADYASDFIIKILGEKGKHSRFAIGVNSLPKGSPLEIDAIFQIRL